MKNREIKFRGWNGINMFNHKISAIFIFKKHIILTNKETYKDNGNKGIFRLRESAITAKGDVIMQYIGLKDKNKKEIYEGDIVLFPNNKKIHIVDFYQSGFVLKSVDGRIIIYNIKSQHVEVIGNIYENPELL